jgi:CBS domain containing-hemolysin-like protein
MARARLGFFHDRPRKRRLQYRAGPGPASLPGASAVIALGIALVLLLTAATGYFVAQEFAYVAVDRGRLRQLADDGDVLAARALAVTSQLSFALSGAQFGITVTALLVGYVSEPLIGTGLADLLGFTGLSRPARLSLSVAAVLVFSTVVQMVLGELAPKNLAIARTVPMARALSRSTLLYLRVAGPVVRCFDVASNRLLRLAGIEPVEELPHGAGAEELHRIIEDSRRGGLLDDELSRLLDRGLGFRDLVAAQVMTPRVDVRTIRADEPVGRVADLLVTGRSRFPVTGRDVDDVVGVVGVPDLLAVPPEQRATTPVADVAQPPLRLPASLPLPAVLDQLRSGRRQLAVILDEYGGFAGVISFEDVAEEVVGDILDEDDPAEPGLHHTAPGAWTLPARLRLDEVEGLTGVALPSGGDYDTVSGLLLDRLGRTASVGDRVDLELAPAAEGDGSQAGPARTARLQVLTVHRHVPASVTLQVLIPAGTPSPEGR